MRLMVEAATPSLDASSRQLISFGKGTVAGVFDAAVLDKIGQREHGIGQHKKAARQNQKPGPRQGQQHMVNVTPVMAGAGQFSRRWIPQF